MDLQLPEQQVNELALLAQRRGKEISQLVAEAVDRLVAEESWFDAQVQIGIDQIARREFIEEEEMNARIARILPE